MDNKGIVNALSKKLARDPKDITALIEGLSASFRERCGNMDTIAIPGFGTFEPIKEDERISVDLSTGKRLLLPPQITLSFQTSAILRKKLNETTAEK